MDNPAVDLPLEVARLRYEAGMAQKKIATSLGISEATVSRALKRALASGLVDVRVSPHATRETALEQQLVRRFGLAFAVVVATRSNAPETRRALGEAVGRVLADRIEGGMVIGVSDGQTTAALAAAARRLRSGTIDVVALLGGVGRPQAETHPNEVCRVLAARLGGTAWPLLAPVLLDDANAVRAIETTSAMRAVFARMDRVSLAIMGLGGMTDQAAIVRGGAFTAADMAQATAAGAVGSICARFFDQGGRPVTSGLDARTLAIRMPQLARVPVRLAVAFGPDKFEAIALRLPADFAMPLAQTRRQQQLCLEADHDRSGTPAAFPGNSDGGSGSRLRRMTHSPVSSKMYFTPARQGSYLNLRKCSCPRN